ncbi:hypothetical protein LH53_11190 [Mesotoga sp. TolDC]|nr:hypothetical protein LH53_11190 [Mesotoga sp. TolDC]
MLKLLQFSVVHEIRVFCKAAYLQAIFLDIHILHALYRILSEGAQVVQLYSMVLPHDHLVQRCIIHAVCNSKHDNYHCDNSNKIKNQYLKNILSFIFSIVLN